MKKLNYLTIGFVVGIVVVGTAARATEMYLSAVPSTQTFYVDGQQTDLEVYAIEGHNYVKLRDIGRAANFEVRYDPSDNSVHMEPNKPYTGADISHSPTSEDTTADSMAEPNPAIFTGNYTREMYDAFRHVIQHPDEMIVGTYCPVFIGSAAQVDVAAAMRIARKLGGGSVDYSIVDTVDGSMRCLYAQHDTSYDAAIAHVQPFLKRISHLPPRDQVREMVWYIADRMTYNVRISALPSQILAQDEVMADAGNCMTYSSSLLFLCEQAGIPCILVSSGAHQWNMVYLEDGWWNVDPTANKENIQTMTIIEYANGRPVEIQKTQAERAAMIQSMRNSSTLFYKVIGEISGTDGNVRIDPTYIDEAFGVTQFLQELMVPGSTK